MDEQEGLTKTKNEELTIEAKNFFDFHKKELGESIRKGNNIIYLDFMKLTEFSNKLSDEILSNPEDSLRLIELAIEESGLVSNVRVRLFNLPKSQELKVRNIRSKNLNEMVVVEGIIRQASDVRPQVVNAKFECPSCGTIISVLQIEKKFREPSRCSCGRRGSFKLISKEMVDTQRLVVEESPESLSGGEQPKRINVFVKEDLVEPKMEEKTTPGSRIKTIGILKEVPVPLSTGGLSTRFELAIEANNVIPLEETFEELDISEEDERQILELAEDPKIFEKLARSITPSVWGYEEIKKSLVLQLFSGVAKIHADGQKSRGDIHILLIGDPGVAKSIGKNEKIMYISEEETGYETIETLYNKFGENPQNLEVLTINQKTQEPEWEKVNEIIKHLPEKKLIKVRTEHGKTITATKDHSFITLSKEGEIVPIKGDIITKENYLPLPINYHKEKFKVFNPGFFNKKQSNNSKLLPDKIDLNEDFGFFIGIFLAEGYIKNEKTIEISNKNSEIQNKVMNLSEKMKLNYCVNKNSIQIYSKNLSDMLKSYCYNKNDLDIIIKGTKGNYSRIKKIPEFLFFSPREFIYGLISGLFSGDGRLIRDKKMLKGFELITISKYLAENTSDILFSIGIINKIKTRAYTYKNKKTEYFSVSVPTYMIKPFLSNIKVLGRDIKINEKDPIYSYNDLIPCGDLIYKVVKKLGYNSRLNGNRTLAAEMRTVKKRNKIGRLRLLRLIKEFDKKSTQKIEELEILKKIANSNIVWSRISDISLLEKMNEEVYDLSIPSTNTFVANGIGVHNSVTLTFMANISPKGRYVVGKSTSGAGLTATVVRDEYLKGWSLEAGAMVLSNKGLVCIDELEKMDPNDRGAMHEAMEQQTITISKANVQACYSEDTKVLTEQGWKKYNEVENLKIAQYNPKERTIKFLSHKGVYVYDYKGKMYHFINKRNDILVTPNHKMLAREYGQKELKAIPAENLNYNYIKFVNSGKYIGADKGFFIIPGIKHKQKRTHEKYTHQHKDKKIPANLWLEFLGYYVTEGGVETNPTIGIVQKKGSKAEKIKKCLKKLTKILGCSLSEIDCGKYVRFKITQTQIYNYLKDLGLKCHLKKIGLNFSEFSKKQLEIIFNAMMLGDGSSDGKYFSCTSEKLVDEFQTIAHLIGKSVSKNIHNTEGKRGRKATYRITISERIQPSIRKKSIKTINYEGKVYCFSTSTGFFVTRRNGKIAIQGNTLRAETSVLAAANPKFGRFDPYQSIAQQIDLPPTLINRFDVIFTLRDIPNREKDERIATHVLHEHIKEGEHMLIPRELFRKYVAYAKQRVKPELTDEAILEIKKFYVELRNRPISSESIMRPIPISARQLQALIRMAEASAKIKLSQKVTAEDARNAIELMKYYLMQVGYDYESKTFDIDKGTGGIPSSERNKILTVRDTIVQLENRLGKMIPIEEIEKELEGKLKKEEIEEAINKLSASGEIFKPRRGFVGKT